MEAVLGIYSTSDVTASFPDPSTSFQVLVPYSNFTCDGNILNWTFAAEWEGNSPLYTELQIWRSTGSGSFTKVGNTTIMVKEEGPTQLHQYPLSSPLAFQAGDILGYFQGASSMSQLKLLSENVGSGHLQYYSIQNNPASQFTINEMNHYSYPLIHVETGEPITVNFVTWFRHNSDNTKILCCV